MPGRNWSSEIWVTGVGCVSAAGPGNAALGALLESGSGALRADPLLGIPTGRAPDPPPLRQVRHLDRTAQFFAMAAEEAWASAGLTGGRDPPSDVAVIEGSSLGSMADLLGTQRASGSHAHTSRPHPSHLVRYMPDAGAMAFAQAHGVEGPVFSVSAGSISGALAILEGYRRLATGEVDLIVAGGSECPVDRDIIGTFQAAGVIADPAECRPFDRHRKGTVLGEGSGALVLEQAGHAVARGAQGLARILGVGQCTEHSSRTGPRPDGAGIRTAAERALATTRAATVGWIKAHGTGTRSGDAAEARALHLLFGDRLGSIPLTGLKSSLGHTLGASGALEAVAVVLAFQRQIIPATLGHDQSDPELPSCRVTRTVMTCSGGSALLLAESFGGRCAAMVLAPV